MERDRAYRVVQQAVQRARAERTPLRELIAAEPAIEALRTNPGDGVDLDQIFDYSAYIRHAREIVARLDELQ
jgi:adenylosuccinate lyase